MGDRVGDRDGGTEHDAEHAAGAEADADDVAAARLWQRVVAVADDEHRLPLGDDTGWDLFPYEADDLRMRPLQPPVAGPITRAGEDGTACGSCRDGLDGALWANEGWKLRQPDQPASIPFVTLEPRDHLDLTDLPEAMAAELGVLLVRLASALERLPGTERAHVNKWGDGAAHLHVFGFGRPARFPQLRGSLLTLWMDSLPVMPAEEWQATGRAVAEELARAHGGQVVVEEAEA